MLKEALIPLEDMSTTRIDTTSFKIPPYLAGKIGIKEKSTERLMGIGGIRKVTVLNLEDDGGIEPQVVGIGSQGEAISGASKVIPKTLTEVNNFHQRNIAVPIKGSTGIDLRIKINVDALAESIAAKGEVNSADMWAKSINRIVNGALRKEGARFSLKSSSSRWDWFIDGTQTISELMLLGGVYYLDPLLIGAGAGGVALRFGMLAPGLKKLDPEVRFDGLFSAHPGRAFWTEFRARTAYKTLVATLEK